MRGMSKRRPTHVGMTIGMNGRTMKRLMKDFKYYNMEVKLNISE